MSSTELPCNYEMALKRLFSTEKRLLKNSALATAYAKVIDSYIKKGYVKKINPSAPLSRFFSLVTLW